jgi:hypothetical protein
LRKLITLIGYSALTGLAITLSGAPLACADDDSYVAALNTAGVPLLGGPGKYVAGGYRVCDELRHGESPAGAATQFGMYNGFGPAIVSAAQHELCPDTLH